jgi:uncharacterized protein with FMN-binding domain
MAQETGRKGSRALKVIFVVLIVLVIAVGAFITFVLAGKQQAMNLKLEGISPAAAADGVYTGSYSGFRWSNTVMVTVKDHIITDIKVVKEQVIMSPETAQALKDEVLSAQTTDVDTVSGATATSKAFLLAVENALKSAPAA